MRLTEDEFVECLETFSKMYQEESEILDVLDCSPDWKPGEWINSYYNMLHLMCDFSEEQYESAYGTPLDYYCWETDFGKSIDAEIKSPKELYRYITGCEKGKTIADREMTNEEVIEILQANYPDKCYEDLRKAVDIAIEALKTEPKHGRWIYTEYETGHAELQCSECGEGVYNKTKFCPNCGAKMDLDEAAENVAD